MIRSDNMNLKEENYINKLTTLYRTDIYETEDVDLNKISNITIIFFDLNNVILNSSSAQFNKIINIYCHKT